jgi:membrane fusion protein (multidrug efflux system)
MLKRMIVMLTATLAIVAGLGFVKFKQIQTAIAQGAAFQPPPEAVTTIVASEEQWPASLTAIGTVAAVRGVTVSADLPGVVDRIAFESGQSIRQGDVIAVLDTRQERAQLAAAEAQRDLARINFERRPTCDRATRGSAKSARRSIARPLRRRSRESSASARSTSDSICRRATRW